MSQFRNHLKLKYVDAGRPPVIDAIAKTMAEYDRGNAGVIGHDLPPRVGKSSVIYGIALEARIRNAPFVHALTPWDSLATQLKDPEKINGMIRRYAPKNKKVPGEPCRTGIATHEYWQRNNATKEAPYLLLTSTLHLALSRKTTVLRAVGYAHELTRKRPIFIIDECQLLGEDGKWTTLANDLIGAGAFVVTLTGTALRRDQTIIPGFDVKTEKEWKKYSMTQRMYFSAKPLLDENGMQQLDADGLPLIEVPEQKINGQKRENCVMIARGEQVTWNVAFGKGWLNHLNAYPVDFQCVTADGVVYESIYDLKTPEPIVRANLSKWIRSAECCRKLSEAGIDWLQTLRLHEQTKNAKMLVVTTSDLDEDKKNGINPTASKTKEYNVHAREMRRMLQRYIDESPVLGPQGLTVEICTSVRDNGDIDEDAAEKIARFSLTEQKMCKKTGKLLTPIDVLIVKGMGVVGLDCPECKVLIDASQVRCGPMKKQLAARPLTVWNGANVSSIIIYPKDRQNHAYYENLQRASDNNRFTEQLVENVTNGIVIEPEQEKENHSAVLVPESGVITDICDENGKWLSGEYDQLLRDIYKRWPAALGMRPVDVIQMHKDGGLPLDPTSDVPSDAPVDAEWVVKDADDAGPSESFGDKATRLINDGWPGLYKQNSALWLERYKELIRKAKLGCRISPSIPTKDIDDPALLSRLVDALDDAFVSMYQGAAK